jgi:hypothetical protein
MTVYEILNFNKELINRLSKIGFKPDDYKYIDLYSDFESMRCNGDKVTYIVSFLADKYSVSERKIYDVIKRFGKRCTFRAV